MLGIVYLRTMNAYPCPNHGQIFVGTLENLHLKFIKNDANYFCNNVAFKIYDVFGGQLTFK